jgi:N-acetylmuramoyl-L-alanine amidase
MRSFKLLTLLILTAVIAGCSTTKVVKIYKPPKVEGGVLFEYPRDLINKEKREQTIDTFKTVLDDKTFFIDPGHGGEDRRNTSDSGKVIEADVNLRVSLFLKDFLENAGADVIMSRDEDETVGLKERSKMANETDSDFFISIHHNATGIDSNYWTNYTSTFYHATPSDYEFQPCEKDLARYIQRDLAYVMRNPGGLGSFDGTYSDYMIYPGAGFSVLRETEIPAVLVECSFYTNRNEIQRLNDKEFNKIQAWGIFRGIGKYYLSGFPKVEFLVDSSRVKKKDLSLQFRLSDTTDIDPYSIETYFDSTLVGHRFYESSNILELNIENAGYGEHTVRVICANKEGKYALPFRKKILLRSENNR